MRYDAFFKSLGFKGLITESGHAVTKTRTLCVCVCVDCLRLEWKRLEITSLFEKKTTHMKH